MLAFIAISLILTASQPSVMHTLAADLGLPIHEACLAFTPSSPHSSLYQSLVCGADFPSSDTYRALQKTGLLHLIVVSGSHFLVLEHLLGALVRTAKLPKAIVLLSLIGFALITLLQPPAARALLSLSLRIISQRFSLAWTHLQVATISGFFSFLFCRDSSATFSLILSWTAALALCLAGSLDLRNPQAHPHDGKDPLRIRLWHLAQSSLKTSVIVYAFITPVLLPVTINHPASILCNWLIGPILGILLFPGALMAFVLPGAVWVTDMIWDILAAGLERIAAVIPENPDSHPLPITTLLIYVFSLNLILLLHEWHLLKRARTWR